jgi:hypothetical protein
MYPRSYKYHMLVSSRIHQVVRSDCVPTCSVVARLSILGSATTLQYSANFETIMNIDPYDWSDKASIH